MCFIICCSREASPSSSGHYGQMGGRRKIAPLTADSLLKLCVSVAERTCDPFCEKQPYRRDNFLKFSSASSCFMYYYVTAIIAILVIADTCKCFCTEKEV